MTCNQKVVKWFTFESCSDFVMLCTHREPGNQEDLTASLCLTTGYIPTQLQLCVKLQEKKFVIGCLDYWYMYTPCWYYLTQCSGVNIGMGSVWQWQLANLLFTPSFFAHITRHLFDQLTASVLPYTQQHSTMFVCHATSCVYLELAYVNCIPE